MKFSISMRPATAMHLPSDTSVRLFLALWPASDVLRAVEVQAAAWHGPAQARRTRPERLHVTLAQGLRRTARAPLHWRAGPQSALVRSLPGGRGYENLQCFG